MPDDSHTGFEFWEVNDLAFAFPIGQIDLEFSDESGAGISCEFTVPAAIPHKKTVAERSIGIKDSYKFWVALECTIGAGGAVACEAVVRARHVFWFESHGESGPGPLMEIRLSTAEVAGAGRRQELDDHGHHCDSFTATWLQKAQGRVYCHMTGFHWAETPAEFRAARKRAQEHADYEPPLPPLRLTPLPAYDWDRPLPKPVDPNVDN
jgi:hypothetical protein